MKRIIIILSVLAILCSCLVVPSFAADTRRFGITLGSYATLYNPDGSVLARGASPAPTVYLDLVRGEVYCLKMSLLYKVQIYVGGVLVSTIAGSDYPSPDTPYILPDDGSLRFDVTTSSGDGDYEFYFQAPNHPYNPVTDADSIVTNAIAWVNAFAGFIMDHPLVLFAALLGLCGIGIGLLERLRKQRG